MPSDKSRIAARTIEMGTGFLTLKAMDYAFDYVAYPFAIWKLGALYGGLLMSGLSLLICLLLLRVYDLLERDWLGIEFIKNQRHYAGPSYWRGLVTRIISRADWFAFAILSLRYDPFITTAYLRHGAYNGMNRRDWIIFMGSWFVSNGVWIAVCFGGVSVLEFLT